MRTPTLLLLFTLLCTCVRAQIPGLKLSPYSTTETKLATTQIEFTYARPSMRGRKIFGGLEPYGKIWRGGANRNPRLVVDKDFYLGDNRVEAGSYTLFFKPDASRWTVYLYTEVDQYGAPELWDEAKVAASIQVTPDALTDPIETLGYSFEEVSNDHFTIVMRWEHTKVTIPFKLTTSEEMESLITKTLGGPDRNDYSSAALYALRDTKDYEQAIRWFDKAMALGEKPRYWEPLHRAQALEKLGRTDEAIVGATNALKLARQVESEYGIGESEALLARLKRR